jgi:hypothetical protein
VKPKLPRMAITSAPERRRSLGVCGLKLQSDNDCWLGSEPHRGQVLAFQMECDRFPEVADHFVQSGSLGDHGNLQAFADIAGLLAGTDGRLIVR